MRTNKLLLIILLLVPGIIFADLYDEAMKLEAKGYYDQSINKFREYFDKNLNDDNQHGIIEKLIYSSTLFPEIRDSLLYLEHYVKYMVNDNSRYRIYKKIGEIYELTGDNINAGKFYEKAAFTVKDYLDYNMLLDSLDILIEVGYYKTALDKLEKLKKTKIDSSLHDRLYYSLSRAYYLKGDLPLSNKILENINNKDSRYWFHLSLYNGYSKGISKYPKSIEYLILNKPEFKLRSPSDYFGRSPDFNILTRLEDNNKNEQEICLGSFDNSKDAAGIVNVLDQLNIDWFFDTKEDGETLYIFTENRVETMNKLDKLGIYYE